MSLPFSRVVRDRMKERGVGLRELCRAVELDPSFFSKVLADKRSPPSEERVLRKIAERLELDAPRLIVAAGRIPAEWRRLWTDEALFHSVHRMAAGSGWRAGAPAKPRASSWGSWDKRPPSKTAVPPKEIGEELL